MHIRSALQALFAVAVAGAAIGDQGVENSVASGPLPISYGKCYKIQTVQRTWMAARNDNNGYQWWNRLLKDADVYKICQHKVDGSCEYDAVRAVQGGEDYFIWDFNGSVGRDANLLAAYLYFFPSYGSYRRYIFHFQGEEECEHDTTPCAIRTGGHNERNANGLRDSDGSYPVRTTDESTVLLWYHEVDCPE